jgi:hypothetical protein
MLEMHGNGASAREIGDALEMNHGTILRWLEDAGLKPNGGHGTRKDRERNSPTGAAAALADSQKRIAEFTSEPAPTDYEGVLARYRKQFAIAAGLVEFCFAEAMAGRSTMVELDKATKVQDHYAIKIRELTPTTPQNPADDPSNLEAAAELRRRLAMLVESAERMIKCKACGANPYGKNGGAP